ncbi:hypothetical protein SAMN05421820_101299 [Pedobacter steynii]|uniref:Uncharacterized protein n=1 Tax=Pedobacter steynii TaxID=430522 RepID=A0A1G9JKH4_9SPHI|nr:hypothetical protein [Pedobacter steynii]NQX38285.1 hypothetical protein [Pedobacter steynii]SDL38120.1 hypothetical protein SAMN05421820_101299 [Pedobacter steynii]
METKNRQHPIDGTEGNPIDSKIAAAWTAHYRIMNPNETISHFFGNQILQQILAQPDCLGIRIYYANELRLNWIQRIFIAVSNFLRWIAGAYGVKHLILVGSDKDGIDQVPEQVPTIAPEGSEKVMMAMSFSTEKYTMAEQASPCPGGAGCPENELTS